MLGAPTIVDLFCGAGGLSSGLSRAGCSVVYAADHWDPAVASYKANLAHHVVRTEVSSTSPLPDADVIVGGPPCQGFSSAGSRRPDDPRNSMVREFATLIANRRPRAFVFENVEGFLTAAGGARVFDLLEPLIDAGYQIHLRKINAAAYGVPQHRKRVIAMGGLGWTPAFPAPTHNAFGAPGAHRYGDPRLTRAITLGDALYGLPPVNSTADASPTDHTAKPLSPDDLARASALRPGMTMRDLPQELWHPSYARRANRRVSDGTPTERRGGAPAGLRRLRADEPSKAITSGARSEFLHPSEDRTLTLRECARIQTFDDSYVFLGSASEKATLIGNAVPPALAEHIGRALVSGLQANGRVRRPSGALVSFVPTASEGMSPALLSLHERILARFGTEDVRQLALSGL